LRSLRTALAASGLAFTAAEWLLFVTATEWSFGWPIFMMIPTAVTYTASYDSYRLGTEKLETYLSAPNWFTG
jgi:hypothetical protein